MWVGCVALQQAGGGDQGCDAWEVGVKELSEGEGGGRDGGIERGICGGWHEERAGEGAVVRGDCDEHVVFAGPDVEVVG